MINQIQMNKLGCMKLIAGGIACVLGGTQALSAVLYTQNFETLSPGSLAGQDGYTAMAETQIASGGLSYTNGYVVVDGGTQSVYFKKPTGGANHWTFSREFEAQSGPVYFALAMTWTSLEVEDMLFFAFSNDADSTPAALANSGGVYINRNGTQIDGLINGRMRLTSANQTDASTTKTGGKNTGSPQFIVGCIDKESSTNYNRLRLWVNPTSYREGAPDVTVTRDIGISSGLDTFYFFSGSGNDKGEENRVDNICIGTTWADVMSSPFGTVISVR